MAKRSKSTESVGERLVGGLREFAEVLQTDKSRFRERYPCRRVKLDLQPTSFDQDDVRQTRAILGVSQAVFAEFLGVSVKTIQAWEQGVNPPQNAACRLMEEIRHDPDYWRARLSELTLESA